MVRRVMQHLSLARLFGSLAIGLLGALATGLMVAVLVPPFNMGALVWVCLVPMLASLWSLPLPRPYGGLVGFAFGWVAGMISFAIQLLWLTEVSTLAAIILPAYLALFWGTFGAFAATWGNPWRHRDGEGRPIGGAPASLRTAFQLAAVWAGLEWLRGWLFTGFGWNGLGVAFHETLVIAQAADIFGVAGLSMLVVFFQSVLIHAGRRLLQSGSRRVMRWDFAVAAMCVALALCYGLIRVAIEDNRESVRLRTLLVQLNIPQNAARVLWAPEKVHMAYEEETLAALEKIRKRDEEELRKAITSGESSQVNLQWPDWVMWPETALHGRILMTDQGIWGTWQENIETIRRVREAGEFHLLFGITELEAEEMADGQILWKENGAIWNSLAAMGTDDSLQTFRKHHLVIFGEYIPFVESIPFLRSIYEQQSGAKYTGAFTPGSSFDPLKIETQGHTIGAIPSVCFEDTVPRLNRRFVRPGPQVIVNVTNDGWFKRSPAAAQHFANARFRAIELRRPMLRCANSGVSAAVDARGSTAHPDHGRDQRLVDQNGSHFTRGSLLVELDVPLVPGFSLYAALGDWPIIVLALLGFGWAAARRKTTDESPTLTSPKKSRPIRL
jgi:apolipoprotein N-acyltransferase